MMRDNYLATIWNQERERGSKSNFHTNLWFCGRNLPTTSTILLSAMFESFLYPKWRYGPAAAPLRSTHTTHKNLFLVLIPFFHDPQARPEMVLGSALEAAQSRAELGDDSSSSYIYTYIHTYIGGISFIPQASKLEVVASKASGTKRDWTLHGLKIIILAVK